MSRDEGEVERGVGVAWVVGGGSGCDEDLCFYFEKNCLQSYCPNLDFFAAVKLR